MLVEQYGLEWFSKNIKVLHKPPHSEQILFLIATAINRRLKNKENQVTKASIDKLVAAKKRSNTNNYAFI